MQKTVLNMRTHIHEMGKMMRMSVCIRDMDARNADEIKHKRAETCRKRPKTA